MNKDLSYIDKVLLFNTIASPSTEYDNRKLCLYVSLLTEEYGEMIEAIGMKDTKLYEVVEHYRKAFKEAIYDDLVAETMQSKDKRIELLDALCDINVVSVGAGVALGSDIHGALHSVANNNLEKFEIVNDEYVVLRDEHGKIKKPASFQSVKLDSFVEGL